MWPRAARDGAPEHAGQALLGDEAAQGCAQAGGEARFGNQPDAGSLVRAQSRGRHQLSARGAQQQKGQREVGAGRHGCAAQPGRPPLEQLIQAVFQAACGRMRVAGRVRRSGAVAGGARPAAARGGSERWEEGRQRTGRALTRPPPPR